jgi:hypothetical protein
MEAPVFRVSDLPQQAIRSFRSMAEAEVSISKMTARSIASRIQIPLHLKIRRYFQAVVNFELVGKGKK